MTVSFDITELVTKLNNVAQYTEGFLIETQKQRSKLNKELGEYLVGLLGEYIDSLASTSPESLHHVYEWGQVGQEAGRLFEFDMVASATQVKIGGVFLESSSIAPNGTEPFVDKARIMESGMSVTIVPKNAEALVFEDDGETVFVSTSVTVDHPGGEAVVGSFKAAVESFFNTYVTKEVLAPLLMRMSRVTEYKKYFGAGAHSGRRAGQMAGRQYMNIGDLNGIGR